MTTTNPDAAYYLRRAEDEAIRALQAASEAAAAAHRRLSVLHSARAVLALAGGRAPRAWPH